MGGDAVQRWVAPNFDQTVRTLQRQYKERTGRDISFKDVTERLVFIPPSLNLVEISGKGRRSAEEIVGKNGMFPDFNSGIFRDRRK